MQAKATCELIIKELLKEGWRNQIPHKDLVLAIKEVRDCIDDRTVNKWIKALLTFNYLKLVPTTTFKIYTMNPLKTPELFQLLKDKPQTKVM